MNKQPFHYIYYSSTAISLWSTLHSMTLPPPPPRIKNGRRRKATVPSSLLCVSCSFWDFPCTRVVLMTAVVFVVTMKACIVDGSATSAVQGGAGCYPAGGTFNGVGQSVTTWWGKSYPFQTSYQFNGLATYCWTNAYYYYDERDDDDPAISGGGGHYDYSNYFQSVPNGGGDAWHHIFLDVPFPCCSPCQGQHVDTHSVVPLDRM